MNARDFILALDQFIAECNCNIDGLHDMERFSIGVTFWGTTAALQEVERTATTVYGLPVVVTGDYEQITVRF